MTRKHGFTLVELLVVIAIIAVLLSILIPSLASVRATAQRIQCGTRLKSIGQSITFYTDKYDGLLPRPQHNPYQSQYFNTHYYLYKRADNDFEMDPAKYYWLNLGCLFGSGLIDTGKLFYCPASEGWLEEYQGYSVSGPWGHMPQLPAPVPNNYWLRGERGYIWTPQSRELADSPAIGIYNAKDAGPAGKWANYQLGYPKYARKAIDLNQGKAISADLKFHTVKGSGWNINAVFPDGHVTFQHQPKNTAGLGIFFNGNQFPSTVAQNDAGSTRWYDSTEETRNEKRTLAEYMFALQP